MRRLPLWLTLILLAVVVASAGREQELAAQLEDLKVKLAWQRELLQELDVHSAQVNHFRQDDDFVQGNVQDLIERLDLTDNIRKLEADIKGKEEELQKELKEQTAKEWTTLLPEQAARPSTASVASAPSISQTKEKGVKQKKQIQGDSEKKRLAQSKMYWIPTVETATASTVEGSGGSSEQIQEKLKGLTAELKDLDNEFDKNLNSATMQGKKPEVKAAWQEYFDRYDEVKRNIVMLQLKVDSVKLADLVQLKANWKGCQNKWNKRCGKTLQEAESTAFETGKTQPKTEESTAFATQKWAERNKECIDWEMEIMKLQGQIEQVEPVSMRLKELVEILREHQNKFREALALDTMPKKSLDVIFHRYQNQKNMFTVILSKVEDVYGEKMGELERIYRMKLGELEADSKPLEKPEQSEKPEPKKRQKNKYENRGRPGNTDRSNKTAAELEVLDRMISDSRVQTMKLQLQSFQKKVELITKLEAKVSTTRVALARGSSQTEEAKTSQAKKRKKSTKTSPAKKHKP